mmetsp:Transcript_12117/g.26909  ORF Transcript_12117/g.26909 Transcript_12117/m.26909 type:complete len:220 (+) Transcript_12117:71-730(+)
MAWSSPGLPLGRLSSLGWQQHLRKACWDLTCPKLQPWACPSYSRGRRTDDSDLAVRLDVQLHTSPLCLRADSIMGTIDCAKHVLSESILQHARDGSLERPGSVCRVEAVLQHTLLEAIREGDVQLCLAKACNDASELHLSYSSHVLSTQGSEHHDLVQTVEEFWPEEALHFLDHQLLDPRMALLLLVLSCAETQTKAASTFLHRTAAQVRGHHHKAVGE